MTTTKTTTMMMTMKYNMRNANPIINKTTKRNGITTL